MARAEAASEYRLYRREVPGLRSVIEGLLGIGLATGILLAGGSALLALTLSIALMLAITLLERWRQWVEIRRLKRLEAELVEKFRAALADFVSPEVTAARITITYYVGLFRFLDSQERHFEFEVGQGEKAIFAKELDYGAAGTLAPKRTDFGALGLDAVSDPADTKVMLLPMGDVTAGGSMKVCAWFVPTIRPGDRRALTISARTRGVWNDLRAEGTDPQCSYRLTDKAGELRVVIVPPPGISVGDLDVCQAPDQRSEGSIQVLEVRPGVVGRAWVLKAPLQKTYVYHVECAVLRGRWHRFALACLHVATQSRRLLRLNR